MHAIHQAINVEFIHLLHNGRQFLDPFLILMDQTFHCGMLTTTITHLSLIFHLLEDGILHGLSNMLEMQQSAQWVLIKIMHHTLEIFKIIKFIYLYNFIYLSN